MSMIAGRLQTRLTVLTKQYGFRRALQCVVKEIAEGDHEMLTAIWLEFGPLVLRTLRRRHRPLLRLRSSIAEALCQLLPVGNTGEHKELGQLGHQELLILARFRERMGETLKSEAVLLRRVARCVGKETIGRAWNRIPDLDKKALLELVHVHLSDSEFTRVLSA